MDVSLLTGDVIDVLRRLPDRSVQMVVTSPPYFGLRDYGTAKWMGGRRSCSHQPAARAFNGFRAGHITTQQDLGTKAFKETCGRCGARRRDRQIGMEKTPDAFVRRLVAVFHELRRVLKDDGTLWINLGDSYAGGNGTRGGGGLGPASAMQKTSPGSYFEHGRTATIAGLPAKNLIGIPWRVAFALQADGWILRSDIIWHKPNPMPESITDRPTKSHEYLFLMSKRPHYVYDAAAVAEPTVSLDPKHPSYRGNSVAIAEGENHRKGFFKGKNVRSFRSYRKTRNRRTVWSVTTCPTKEKHFATFPPKLVAPCILAGSRVGDVVMDCFSGSATTGVVALEHGRRYIGIDLNPAYHRIARARLKNLIRPLNLVQEICAVIGAEKRKRTMGLTQVTSGRMDSFSIIRQWKAAAMRDFAPILKGGTIDMRMQIFGDVNEVELNVNMPGKKRRLLGTIVRHNDMAVAVGKVCREGTRLLRIDLEAYQASQGRQKSEVQKAARTAAPKAKAKRKPAARKPAAAAPAPATD